MIGSGGSGGWKSSRPILYILKVQRMPPFQSLVYFFASEQTQTNFYRNYWYESFITGLYCLY